MRFGRLVLSSAVALHVLGLTAIADSVITLRTIRCAEGESQKVSLRSTYLLPKASGTARVERMGGTTGIEVELNSIKPAMLFGGDYNTYVLWVVPPGGPPENAGELSLDDDRAVMDAQTKQPEFALLISAEPHFLVNAPSAFVVLQNEDTGSGRTISQPLLEGVYNFDRSALTKVKTGQGRLHTEVKQAFTAVRLAERAGASTLAGEEFAQAQRALKQTISFWRERRDRTEIAAQARETVRLAVAAQRLAQDRAF